MKKKMIIISSIIILILLILLTLFYLPNNTLKNKGYSNLEIKEIEKLSEEELNIISNYDYNNNLIYIISSENYNKNKLNLYMKYTLKYSDIEYLKIFELINNENFDENKIDNYIKHLRKYDNVSNIVSFVNNYEKLNIEINETTLSLMNEKYFIIDYIDRYLNYYKNNKDLSYSEIITRVNSNLDYTFYVDIEPADTSKGMYTLVNKYFYLEKDFVIQNPVTISDYRYAVNNTKLDKTAYENFIKMKNDMENENLIIKITTAYRDYNFQSILYNNYVKADGVNNADTYSARPGHSEHQLGYSFDLTNGDLVSFDDFEYTNEYSWLKENAYKYGFILRYPKNKEYITGYIYEPWHYRYVGVDIATYIYENNITYEEYFAYFLR